MMSAVHFSVTAPCRYRAGGGRLAFADIGAVCATAIAPAAERVLFDLVNLYGCYRI